MWLDEFKTSSNWSWVFLGGVVALCILGSPQTCCTIELWRLALNSWSCCPVSGVLGSQPTPVHAILLLKSFLKNATSLQELSVVLLSSGGAELVLERRMVCFVTGSDLLCFSCCDKHHGLGRRGFMWLISPHCLREVGQGSIRSLVLVASLEGMMWHG